MPPQIGDRALQFGRRQYTKEAPAHDGCNRFYLHGSRPVPVDAPNSEGPSATAGGFCGIDDAAKSLAHEKRQVANVINMGMGEQKNRVDTFGEEGEWFPI